MGLAGEESAAAAADGAGPGAMRIYVGGLSTSVTAADMEKTFSSLGRVAGVEFVRTNGRTFGYMDFEPSSDRSLAKLFSTYNGCVWKGGKLKLEKAKEHYLTRLKKEWEEDANPMPTTPAVPIPEKYAGHLKKLDFLKQENMQLKIFFPKLRKVKALPFKGTGKHKYSFQRIEVPPLPIHFCDCEEHYDPNEMASEKYLSSLNKVVNEKELHVMNSVMNKLLEKEHNGTAAEEMVESAKVATISYTSVDNIQSEEDQETVDDDLATNIGMGGSDDIFMLLNGGLTQSADQKTRRGKLQSSKDRFIQNKENSRKRKKSGPTDASEVTLEKRFPPVLVGKTTEDEFTPVLARNISSQGHSQESEISAEAPPVKSQTELNMDTSQSRKANYWLQKSSWKDLVGKKDNSSFSISSHLPGINPMAPKMVKTNDDSAIAVSTAAKKRKARSGGKEPSSVPVLQMLPEKSIGLNHVEKSEEGDKIHADPMTSKMVEINDDSAIAVSTAAKKRKTRSGREVPSSVPVPQILPEKAILLNHVETSQEGDEIHADPLAPEVVKTNDDSPIAVSTAVVKKRKARSGEEKSTSVSVRQILPEKAIGLNHVEKSKVGDEIHANLEGTIEAQDNAGVESESSQLGSCGQDTMISVGQSQEPEATAEGPSTKGNSWLQKFSWKDLVGDKASSSFSISSVLPGINTPVLNPARATNLASTISTTPKNRKGHSDQEKSNSMPAMQNIPQKKAVDKTSANPEEGGRGEARENSDVAPKRTIPKISIGDGGTFMRTEESVKEWARLKQALSGYIRNNNNEKNASKSSKAMPLRKR